jgi:hypothetical protein
VEREDHPGPFGEQVAATVRDLPQLRERRVDVERVSARMPAGGAWKPGRDDAVWVEPAAGDGRE